MTGIVYPAPEVTGAMIPMVNQLIDSVMEHTQKMNNETYGFGKNEEVTIDVWLVFISMIVTEENK